MPNSMRWVAGLGLALLLCLSMGPTCGMKSEQGEGAPCTRSRDCATGLECIAGTCTFPAVDGGGGDGASEDGGSDASVDAGRTDGG